MINLIYTLMWQDSTKVMFSNGKNIWIANKVFHYGKQLYTFRFLSSMSLVVVLFILKREKKKGWKEDFILKLL